MRFHADLHVHSKYSRATSRDLDLEHLAAWAARKGVAVVATGDFTHPTWRAELKEKLVAAEPGLFRLRPEIEHAIARELPPACRTPVRFMLEVEISTIYKKAEKTRKVHHLIYAPDFATVDRISERLARIGNIASDGRPILGLDSRDLLEITLTSNADAYFIPAHIWTPWFAALGSQSGFDSIAECYGDLADHIFAVETGLSSDPPMNWRLSMLDRYRLVSNSDAHSPGKLGREATTFDCDVDYFAIRKALQTGQGYVGTVEFFPEEGKYHLDGHRKCGVKLLPHETRAEAGRCPVCGGAMTIGVLHRVEALADRSDEETLPPATAGEVSNLVPLAEVLSELAASGPGSKIVERSYGRLVNTLGSELDVLQVVPIEDIARAGTELLGEAVARLRAGKVICDAGYDGEYGVIRLFEEAELRRRTAGGLLFEIAPPNPISADMPPTPEASRTARTVSAMPKEPDPGVARSIATPPLDGSRRLDGTADALAPLDDDQRAAACVVDGPLVIVAGPGSGKTRTLVHRIVHLVRDCGVAAECCLAITFTRRAAAELRTRLRDGLGASANALAIHTFHSLGLAMLREYADEAGLERGFRVVGEAERAAALAAALNLPLPRAENLIRAISKAERMDTAPSGEVAAARAAYRAMLDANGWIDFDDLIGLPLRLLAENAAVAARCRERFRFILVDEFQDIDPRQYRLVTLLAPPPAGNLCVIGDPHQAIYGFRGADAGCFARFGADYPQAAAFVLRRNYRSSGTIVTASSQVISPQPGEPIAEMMRAMHERITIHAAPSERAEAEFVVATIEQAIGGASFFSIDSGRARGRETTLSFADFAVLYRTDAQAAALIEAFAASGIPFRKHSHAPLAHEPAIRAITAGLSAEETQQGGLAVHLRAAAERLAAAAGERAAADLALQRLLPLAESCGGDVARFLDAVAVASDADFWDPRAEGVSLLTLHAAKGLEFPCVFIVGLEDGILPFYWGRSEDVAPEDLAEERRLLYVGMTRARDRLILSRATKRLWRGRVRTQAPSPFLADIESELLKQQQAALRPHRDDRQLRLL